MGGLEDHKPTLALLLCQFAYSTVTLITRASLLEGLSPMVFVVYRQAVATLVIAPVAYFSRRRRQSVIPLGLKSFSWIFLAAMIGIAINQNLHYRGLYLVSSSVASASGNIVPAITFTMAAAVGMEKVNIRSMRTIAKILGTMVCVCGAVSMVLFKGPKLVGAEILPPNSFYASGVEKQWVTGCLLLFASCCCWCIWLILQVPAALSYPDHLSLSAWTCFIGTILSAIVTLFMEPGLQPWKLHSVLQFGCVFFAGSAGSGLTLFLQSWCISKRGPLFSSMFTPLGTVIVTVFAAIFLHEKIYLGSLIAAVCVITGLYLVLWGKAEEFPASTMKKVNKSSTSDMEEHLLSI